MEDIYDYFAAKEPAETDIFLRSTDFTNPLDAKSMMADIHNGSFDTVKLLAQLETDNPDDIATAEAAIKSQIGYVAGEGYQEALLARSKAVGKELPKKV
ncbi:MAG: hypothetical protein H6765_04405 [Candidatus Peribacteria bacterium]|nr:MAG: hypothetical protein H6765_04405 [Candidatus Peribacteria bacterium]